MKPLERRIGQRADELIAEISDDAQYTTEEAAELLRGVTPQWLKVGRCRGFGPKFVKLHRRAVVYTGRHLKEYIAECTQTPKPKSAA